MFTDNPSLIYVVEPEDVPPEAAYKPNFTVSGVNPEVSIKAASARTDAIGVLGDALTMPFLGFPAAVLVAASASSPVIARLFSKDKEQLPKELEKLERDEFESFMRKHAFSIKMTEDAEFVFPPGHPQVGQVYRQHPLAKLAKSGKASVYIPSDKYDDLLLEEREAELLRLLVHLGATKVSITKEHNGSNEKRMSAGVAAGVSQISEFDLSGTSHSSGRLDSRGTREFELVGRDWIVGDRLDRSQFAWVAFEPSWNALIDAREVGGCVKAALEMRETSAYSSDKSFALKVKAKIYNATAQASLSEKIEEDVVLMVCVEFARPRKNLAGEQPSGILETARSES